MPKFKDHTGKKFGKLTALKLVGVRNKKTFWRFRCDCGVEKDLQLYHVTSGATVSCGCHKKNFKLKHGNARKREVSRTYRVWLNMKDRCLNPNNTRADRYLERGIKVCNRWSDSFENFLDDLGEAPEGCTIERIDNDGDYTPENCRWATYHDQSRNKSTNIWYTYKGKRMIARDWEKELGLIKGGLKARLRLGWTLEEALTIPNLGKGNRK